MDYSGGESIWIIALFAGIVPYVADQIRRDPGSANSALMGWVICMCLPFGLAFAVRERNLDGTGALLLGSLFAIYYLAGSRWLKEKVSFWGNPYRFLGGGGICFLAWLLTLNGIWKELSRGDGFKPIAALFQNFPNGSTRPPQDCSGRFRVARREECANLRIGYWWHPRRSC